MRNLTPQNLTETFLDYFGPDTDLRVREGILPNNLIVKAPESHEYTNLVSTL